PGNPKARNVAAAPPTATVPGKPNAAAARRASANRANDVPDTVSFERVLYVVAREGCGRAGRFGARRRCMGGLGYPQLVAGYRAGGWSERSTCEPSSGQPKSPAVSV